MKNTVALTLLPVIGLFAGCSGRGNQFPPEAPSAAVQGAASTPQAWEPDKEESVGKTACTAAAAPRFAQWERRRRSPT